MKCNRKSGLDNPWVHSHSNSCWQSAIADTIADVNLALANAKVFCCTIKPKFFTNVKKTELERLGQQKYF